MFPNVRLMIAAIAATVVALSCGFGLFATFRVNHEPLVRLPAATAPLQRVADNTGALPVPAAAAEPFDRRFQFRAPPIARTAIEPPAQERDERDERDEVAAPAAAAAPSEPVAAAVFEPAAVAEEPKEQTDLPAAESRAPAVTEAAVPAQPANDAPTIAPAAPMEATSEPAAVAQGEDAGAAAVADAAAPDAAAPDAAQKVEIPASDSAVPDAPAVDLAAAPEAEDMTLAAAAPINNPPLPHIRPDKAPKIRTASVAKKVAPAPHETADKVAAKKTPRTHVAARAHRVRRVASVAVTPFDQNSGFPQPNFVTAPPETQPQLTVRRVARGHRAKLASRKVRAANSGTGGPFVSVPSR